MNSDRSHDVSPAQEHVTLLDLLIVGAKHKKLILGLPILAGVVAGIICLFIPNVYTATARILPPQQAHSPSIALLGQLGGLTALAGNSAALKGPGDLYVGMLKSRSVADQLIRKFDLQNLFQKQTVDETRIALASITRISLERDGFIAIEVDGKDPRRAADMANAYIEGLKNLTERLAISEASQRRLFFETQLRLQKDALAAAEVDLKTTQERTGLIKLDEQGRALIEAVAQIRAQIAAKEVQIDAMRSFSTEQNPERMRAEAELKGLRHQLGKLEQNNQNDRSNFLPTGKVPEVSLEYIRKLRDVKYHEAIFELLARQYEVARLDEGREPAIVQVVDNAVVPERKSKPKRALIVVASAAATFLLSMLWAVFMAIHARLASDPVHASRLSALKSLLKGSSRGP